MELRHRAEAEGKLLRFLRRELGMSSTLVGRLKYKSAFLVNGVPVYTNHIVKPGDEITVLMDEATPEYPAEEGSLDILYEDEALIAIDKPPGLMMHPSTCRITGTLANRLLYYYQATGQASAVHPVSRLDRDTFGVVLLTKNAHVHALMCQAQKRGELQKVYEAALYGTLTPSEGTIDAPIARLSERSLLRCVREDGKPALTRYETIATGEIVSHVRLWPLTGRTHQLRVHCAHLGAPVLGDPQYGCEESVAYGKTLGCVTQQLCARSLELRHPLTGEPMKLISKRPLFLPEELKKPGT